MRHLKEGRKLNRTNSHKKALMMNLAQSLIEHKKIHTTEAKAKELRPFIEKLITKAKTALAKEQQGKLPVGQTIDIHTRRDVAKVIHRKAIIQELFDAIAPVVISRNGGYTRIIKTGIRRGDAGETAIIELVDWSAAQDGASSFKRKKAVKKKSTSKTQGSSVAAAPAPIAEAEVVETVVNEEVIEIVAENEAVAEVIETPTEEVAVEVAPEAVQEEVAVEVAPEATQEEVAETTEVVAEASEVASETSEEIANETTEEKTEENNEEAKS